MAKPKTKYWGQFWGKADDDDDWGDWEQGGKDADSLDPNRFDSLISVRIAVSCSIRFAVTRIAASPSGTADSTSSIPMTTKMSEGGGDFSSDMAQPVSMQSSTKVNLPESASSEGSTDIMSSTQWLTGTPKSAAAVSQSQAGYLAKFRGGLSPPNSWHRARKNSTDLLTGDHWIIVASLICRGSVGACLYTLFRSHGHPLSARR